MNPSGLHGEYHRMGIYLKLSNYYLLYSYDKSELIQLKTTYNCTTEKLYCSYKNDSLYAELNSLKLEIMFRISKALFL